MATKKITDESFETDVVKASNLQLLIFGLSGVDLVNKLVQYLEEISDEMKDQV